MYAPTTQEFSAVLDIIAKLNAADSCRGSRQSIADDLLHLLGGDHLASYVWNRDHGGFEDCVALNIEQDHLNKYDAYFQYRDPISPRIQQQRRATIVSEAISRRELERTEFYNDFLIVAGMHHGLDMHIFDGDENIGDLRIWRNRKRPEFGPREVALLELLRPHLINALRRLRQISQLSAERSAAACCEALWQNHPDAGFIVNAAGEEMARNDSAARLIERMSEAQRQALPVLLRDASRRRAPEKIWENHAIRITTSIPASSGLAGKEAAILIELAEKRPVAPAAADLCRLFGLTQREAEVCHCILQGYSDKEIARRLSISFPTVRTHLTNTFSKLDVSSRSALIHRIAEKGH